MLVTFDIAASGLERLVDAVKNGDDVVLTIGEAQVARLVPLPRPTPFPYDLFADEVKGPIPDFLEPMSEDELALWEGRGEDHL